MKLQKERQRIERVSEQRDQQLKIEEAQLSLERERAENLRKRDQYIIDLNFVAGQK